MSEFEIYDLGIVGDGIFSNVFIYNLNGRVNKSQKYKLAVISDNTMFPPCTSTSTATASLFGIKENVSPLGDLLFNSYFFFEEFYRRHNPSGVFSQKQWIVGTTAKDEKKLEDRFSNLVINCQHKLLKKSHPMVSLDSYFFNPPEFVKFLKADLSNLFIDRISSAYLSYEIYPNYIELKLKNGSILKVKTLILAMGAYSKLQSKVEDLSKVVSGSYLYKKFTFDESFYLTIDGKNIVYRKDSSELLISNTTKEGAYTGSDLTQLNDDFVFLVDKLNLDLGAFASFKAITGLRHKEVKRMPKFKAVDSDKVWAYTGAYKNGWTLPFYFSKRDMDSFL